MKTIGLLGGMSWESTILYYEKINQGIKKKLGGLHSAKLMLMSYDFAEIAHLQKTNNWEKLTNTFLSSTKNLEAGKCEALAICTNTMHKLVPALENKINIPIIHIADALGELLRKRNIKTIGLLATSYSLREDFYKKRLEKNFGITPLIPEEKDIDEVHSIIFDELCQGKVLPSSKQKYLEVIASLQKQGAEGIALACTEIGLLIKEKDVPLPVFDTTEIHCEKIVDFCLSS